MVFAHHCPEYRQGTASPCGLLGAAAAADPCPVWSGVVVLKNGAYVVP